MQTSSRPVALVVWTLAIAVAIYALQNRLLRAAGHALVVVEPLERSEFVVVPNWTGESGALEAADLVSRGYARRALVILDVPTPAEKELARRGVLIGREDRIVELVRALGIDDIEVIRGDGDGTTTEAQLVAAWCRAKQVKSIIVVSTTDHSRRLRRLLNRALDGANIHAVIQSTRFGTFEPDSWWKTRTGMRSGIQEIQKLLMDVALHPWS